MSTQMALPSQVRLSVSDRLLALLVTPVAVLMVRMPFPRLATAIERIKQAALGPATAQEAERAVRVARAGGRWFPGRAACLENAVAAVLAGAVRRRSVQLCIGVRLRPYASHAWIEVDGLPIGEPFNPDLPYQPIHRL